MDLGESFTQTHVYLQNLASIQPRTSPLKFAGVKWPTMIAPKAALTTQVGVVGWYQQTLVTDRAVRLARAAGARKGSEGLREIHRHVRSSDRA